MALERERNSGRTIDNDECSAICSKSLSCIFLSTDETIEDGYSVCGGAVQRVDFLLLWGEKSTLWSSLKDQECLVKKGQQLLHWFWRLDSNGAICWRILLFVSLMSSYFAEACFAVLSSFLCSLLELEHDTLHKPLGKRTLIRKPIKNPLQKDT